MFRLLAIPAALLLLLAGAMYLSGGAAQQKADFTFTTDEEIHTLDTQRMSWSQDFRVAYGLWEGLYRLDPKTLVAIPGAADHIDISPDKTVYTFHIRPDARWSNGDPVVAHDFLFAWRRLLEEPGEYTYLYHYIAGAKEYEDAFQAASAEPTEIDVVTRPGETIKDALKRTGETDAQAFKRTWAAKFAGVNFASVGITELDPLTMRVTLIHPVVPFPDICAMPPFFPMNQKAMDKFLDKDLFDRSSEHVRRYDKRFTLPPNLVSNGPYYLESWAYKSKMRLRANSYYWRRSEIVSPIIDQIVAEDNQWGYAMYDSGGADWIPDFNGEIAAELHARRRPDVHVFPAFGTYFYSFNCLPKFNDGSKNPLADKRIRQALSMAIDKRVIVDNVTRMGEIPTTTYIPANSFKGYHTPKGLPYDIAGAKKLLAEAGYPDGHGFPHLSLLFNNISPHSQIGETVSRQWRENLGIEVQLEGIEGKTFADRQHNHDYSICRASWFGDYLDPSTFTDKYKPDSENNEAGWVNPEYSKWCAKADVEPDPAKRLEYYAEAETLLLDEAPILPLYTYVECYLMRDKVYGIPFNSRTMLVLSQPEFDTDMARFLAIRLLQFPLILAVIYLVTFLLVWVAPGDPFSRTDRKVDKAVIEQQKKVLHAESSRSFLAYYPWMMLHGDFGPSFSYDLKVEKIVRDALPVSASLGLFALIVALGVGTSIGTLAAVKRNGVFDWISLSVSLVGISIPSFVSAAVLFALFYMRWHIFKVGQWRNLGDLLMPGLALSLIPMAYIARLTRASMIDVLSADYIRTAVAKGLSRGPVIWKHALRNAFLPILSFLGPAAADTMTGSFVIEKVFNIPGLGTHFVNSVLNRDQTLILGTVMVYSVLLLSMNLLVDVGYAFIDPRIDVTAKRAA